MTKAKRGKNFKARLGAVRWAEAEVVRDISYVQVHSQYVRGKVGTGCHYYRFNVQKSEKSFSSF